jgi:type IV pilus biogenesis protein CpaD/CtpE
MLKKLALASVLLLSGCADYLNRYEGVTLAAGDTQKQNILLQTKDPFNPASNDTAITTDGQRAAGAVDKYRTGQQAGGGGAELPPLPEPVN